MTRIFLLLSIFISLNISICHAQGETRINKEAVEQTKQWITELYEHGLRLEDDTIYISDEFRWLIKNEKYRNLACPDHYSWEITVDLLKEKRYRLAFWYMINIYSLSEEDKILVLKSLITFNELFQMDKVLDAVLYTYVFFDPQISKINDGKPEIIRPDLFEKLKNNVLEIKAYLLKHGN